MAIIAVTYRGVSIAIIEDTYGSDIPVGYAGVYIALLSS
jgi:hypothetical protein